MQDRIFNDCSHINSPDVKLRFTQSPISKPKNKAQRIFPTFEASKNDSETSRAFDCPPLLILSGCGQGIVSTPPGNGNANTTPPVVVTPTTASAAIKHVVVIFGENISFDHYFGTYPNAANTPGEPQFTAAAGTPIPNNYVSNPSLLTQNPNLAINGTANAGNGAGASNPFRLDRAQALTADQDHNYPDEQKAFDGGKMDLFPVLGRQGQLGRTKHRDR